MITSGEGFVKLYVDGVEEQSAAAVSMGTFQSVRFGSSWADGNHCVVAAAGMAMVWTRELSPQMVQSVFSGADEFARLSPSDVMAAQYASQAGSMPWRSLEDTACQQNYESITASVADCKQRCINRRGCQRGFSHRAASNECRIPVLSLIDVLECTPRTQQGHTYYVYAGTHPRPDFRLNLDALWVNDVASPNSEAGRGLCIGCSSTRRTEPRSG